jgi:hypothetical protein
LTKRQKRLTKRERKAADPTHRAGPNLKTQHIHCVACGRHIDQAEFTTSPATATFITCDHGSTFPSCIGCQADSEKLVATHDRTGEPVKVASAWH